jgi:hypothetical protein
VVFQTITAAAAVVAVGAILVVVVRHRGTAGERAGAVATTNITDIPLPPIRRPKSPDDFRFRMFVVEKRRGGDTGLVTGDIENVSENLYRRLKVELELLDLQGAKIATLNDTIVELPAHQTWHVVLHTSDPKAASVRVAGVSEEK